MTSGLLEAQLIFSSRTRNGQEQQKI